MISRPPLFAAAMTAIAVVSACAMPALAQEPLVERRLAPSIVVTEVVERPLVDSIVASGTIRPVQEVFVQPLVDALSIKSLKADVGDRVKQGDVLAELNRDALILEKSRLEANRAKAEAGLAQYGAQVIEAQANADDALRQRDRTINLSRNGTVSTSQVEQQTSAADVALARLNASKQAVAVGEADLKVVDAQLEDIDLRLERTDVKAPVDGIVSARDAKVGAIASGSGTPLFTMIRDGQIELVADVAESNIRRIKPGMAARISLAGSSDVLSGKVRLVSPVVDASTRLGSVHIVVDESSGARSGMYGNARIVIQEKTALSLPQSAVTTGKGGSTARKIDNKVVKQVPIETGIEDRGFVEIAKGLQSGDLVVAKAGAFVRDGDHIEPVRAEPDAAKEGL